MLVFPLSQEHFLRHHFEQQPLIMHGACVAGQIGWSEVDSAMYIGESCDANIRVHKDGFVDESRYTEACVELGILRKRIMKPVLNQLLAEGASVIYNRIESVSPPIRALCNEVARYTGASAIANGYISFGDKETFGNHWDTHDVFAVQLIGRKRWLVYAPTYPLPLAGQTSLLHKHECPPTPVIDQILEAGDVLYIPRGWWHTAVPLQEETFHVAIGTHPHTVIDYASWVAKNIWPERLAARKAVRIDPRGFDTVMHAKEELIATLFNEASFNAFVKHQTEVERLASPFNMARPFRPSLLEEISQQTYVLNSKFDGSHLDQAATVNGASIGHDTDNLMVLKTLAAADRPMSYRELRDCHPVLGGYELRVTLDDLLRRDIIAWSAMTPSQSETGVQ